jgi:hypothetical protein
MTASSRRPSKEGWRQSWAARISGRASTVSSSGEQCARAKAGAGATDTSVLTASTRCLTFTTPRLPDTEPKRECWFCAGRNTSFQLYVKVTTPG